MVKNFWELDKTVSDIMDKMTCEELENFGKPSTHGISALKWLRMTPEERLAAVKITLKLI